MASRAPHVASSTAQALTCRQLAVLRLVLEGWTNQDIATSLRISNRTVEVHRSSLMRRLQVRNVAQLMREAAYRGLVTVKELAPEIDRRKAATTHRRRP